MNKGKAVETPEKENKFRIDFFDFDSDILASLLEDRTSKKNLIWATNNYIRHGYNYFEKMEMTLAGLKKKSGWIIQPRVFKSLNEQKKRSKDMAEVFTPSWVCNKQNNLVDNDWFGYENAFNEEINKSWKSTDKVEFKNNKRWEDYVSETRMEITCGEAPYLTSRYDTVSGNFIDIKDRIGLLDRKLRVINENTSSKEEWIKYALLAMKNIYGFDYQGDNVFIARINVLSSIDEFYKAQFGEHLSKEELKGFVEIIDWNIFQMDGLKFVIPLSCHFETEVQGTLFGDEVEPDFCEGCRFGNNYKHNGKYVYIMDWEKNTKVKFISLGGGRL